MAVDLSTLPKYFLDEIPGYDSVIVLRELRNTLRDLCWQTEAWRGEHSENGIEPIPVTDFQEEYAIPHGYNAEVKRILKVCVNTVEYPTEWYYHHNEGNVRFKLPYVPADLDNMLLRCGTAGIITAASWAGITDGTFAVTIDGTEYDLQVDFTGASTMDQVAGKIQTAIRVAIDNREVYCRYYSKQQRFSFWCYSCEIGALSASGSGTDISSSTHLNGRSTVASNGGYILVDAALVPSKGEDNDLPDWFVNRWLDAIIAGTLARVLAIPNESWSNAKKAGERQDEYSGFVAQGRGEVELFAGQKGDARADLEDWAI